MAITSALFVVGLWAFRLQATEQMATMFAIQNEKIDMTMQKAFEKTDAKFDQMIKEEMEEEAAMWERVAQRIDSTTTFSRLVVGVGMLAVIVPGIVFIYLTINNAK